MTTQYRIQDISPSIRRECLAERTHIYVDWLALLRGELSGEAQFDNAWFLQDKATGAYIAKESQPAPTLNVSIAEAMAFSMPLAEPISVLTGAHVNAFLRALHTAKMEELFAPAPVEPPAEPAAAEQAEAQAAAEKAAQVPP